MIKLAENNSLDEQDAFDVEIAESVVIDRQAVENLRSKVDEFFAPGGILKQIALDAGRSYEFRPQQLKMASAIVEALIDGKNLSVEAPTGVGKSFAYLIPLIFRSEFAKKRALISTETINLQEQLINKDIPLLQKITGIEFKAVLAKGRSNYICLRRFFMLSGEEKDALLPVPSMTLELDKINRSIEKNQGERSLLNFRISSDLWSLISSESGNCQMTKCPHFKNCFYFCARRDWENADIIVANHALFFTDLRLRMEDDEAALLPDYGTIVIDEAHTLEGNGAEHLGLYLSRSGVNSLLNRLYNPENAKGLLLKNGSKALELRKRVADLHGEVFGFFQQFEAAAAKNSEGVFRVRTPGGFIDTLSPFIVSLYNDLGDYADEQEDAGFKLEIESCRLRCAALIDGIGEFIQMVHPESVYYIENIKNNVILRGAPLNVAEILRKNLFNGQKPVILSSATLTINQKFDFFHRRTGFTNGESLILDSPFDPAMVRAFVPKDMVDPNAADYFPKLIEYIKYFIVKTSGKAFVLFTSYSLLRKAADEMSDFFAENKIRLLVQGGDLSRSMMLQEFKDDVNSVIFGTDSFWTGVDVPGEALSNVIITKLPFAVPNHPLIAARGEIIEQSGGNSFRDYSIPEAVLKFRQGIGRLIRSKNDRGIIVILDKRIISKNYGVTFSRSMPYKLELI